MKYFSDRGGSMAATYASLAVMLLIAYLYGAENESIFYMAVMSFSITALFFAVNAVILRSRRAAVRAARGCEGLPLPQPHGAFEAEYMALAESLAERLKTVESDYSAGMSDMSDYYAMWAHQIKTPIAGMRLMLQSGGTRRDMELDAELSSIEMYVDMALNYARLDGDDLVVRECGVGEILRKSIRRFSKQFILSNISLEYRPVDISVVTDEKWLGFIFEQLIANAVKYTASGKITVFSEGAEVIIQDTGIGISPEDLPRVFEKGYTGYNGRTERKSTGIGLYLCRRVCDKLGHSLRLESEPGRGTRAIVRLENARIMFE